MKASIKKYFKQVSILGILTIFIIIFAVGMKNNEVKSISEIFTNSEALANMYNIFQIIASYFVVTGVVIAVWQYVLQSKIEIKKNETDRVQKAIELSAYYKDNILNNTDFIHFVYKETGILDILNKANKSNMKNFDYKELNDNYSNEDLNKIRKIILSQNFWKTVLLVGERYNRIKDIKETSIELNEQGKPVLSVKIDENKLQELYLNGVVSETLNNLEYFAMNFTHNVADESVVYQSLHNSYIEIIQVLYYNISVNNKNSSKKLYANVTELYNCWIKKEEIQKEKEAMASRQNVDLGTKVCD